MSPRSILDDLLELVGHLADDGGADLASHLAPPALRSVRESPEPTRESRANRKLSFTLSLDCRLEEEGEVSSCLPPLDGLRVLVVDENAGARQSLCASLARLGPACDGAPDVGTAREMLSAEERGARPYDVVFLDGAIRDPRLGELLEGSRRAGHGGGPELVRLTNRGSGETPLPPAARRARRLARPLRESELANCLLEIAGGGGAWGEDPLEELCRTRPTAGRDELVSRSIPLATLQTIIRSLSDRRGQAV